MTLITVNVRDVIQPAYCICSSAYSSLCSKNNTCIAVQGTTMWLQFLFCPSSQDHLLDRNPLDSTHQDAADQSRGFILVDEPHIMLVSNNENTESSPSNRMSDENISQNSAADTVNLTSPGSLTQMSEEESHNVTSPTTNNVIPSMAPKGHLEANSKSLLRNIEEGRHSSLQHRESLPSVPAVGTGNIVYGSDQRIYRIHKGPSGPIGPQGRRVSIFSMDLIRHTWLQGPSFDTV